MTTALVVPSLGTLRYRSRISGRDLKPEDLTECPHCERHGSIRHYVRVRIDDHGWRLAVEHHRCRGCDGHGVVEPIAAHGTVVCEPVLASA